MSLDISENRTVNLKALGQRLKSVRTSRGYTQADVAALIGVSFRAYHSYENGKRAIPAHSLIVIAECFDIDLNWLMRGLSSRHLSDFEADVKSFVSSFYHILYSYEQELSAESIAKIVAMWLEQYRNGRMVPLDIVKLWIELLHVAESPDDPEATRMTD